MPTTMFTVDCAHCSEQHQVDQTTYDNAVAASGHYTCAACRADVMVSKLRRIAQMCVRAEIDERAATRGTPLATFATARVFTTDVIDIISGN